jgi:hypothetical protein
MPYTLATIVRNEELGDGRTDLGVEFSGADAKVILRAITIDGATTAASLRAWAIAQRDNLNGAKTLAKLAALQVGQSLDLTPAASPVQTAREKFFEDLGRWQRVAQAIQVGILIGDEVEVVALKKNVQSDYLPAYLSAF